MRHAHDDDSTQILPSPDTTVTSVQPFPALRDAMRPSVRTPPPTAYGLPLWRSETPVVPIGVHLPSRYGFREVLTHLAEDAELGGFQAEFNGSLARVLGQRLVSHEATPLEVLEIIQALV